MNAKKLAQYRGDLQCGRLQEDGRVCSVDDRDECRGGDDFWVVLRLVVADGRKDRVIAMYFHRTQRCPTCQKMGSYSEEAVKTAFAKELKRGQVAFYFIDLEDAKNARYSKAYDVSGPALIVAKIADNKVASYRNLEEIWSHVGDKDKFLSYVQENVKASLPK